MPKNIFKKKKKMLSLLELFVTPSSLLRTLGLEDFEVLVT